MANIKKIWFDEDVLDLDNITGYATEEYVTNQLKSLSNHVGQYYYTKTQVQGLINTAKAETLEAMYPVGSIYMSVNETNPSTLFGGTWEQIQDTFLLACGTTFANGSTGGEISHTLISTECSLPAHSHVMTNQAHTLTTNAEEYKVERASAQIGTTLANVLVLNGDDGVIRAGNVTSTVGGQNAPVAHNNMPPYLAVYVWKRTE